MARIVRPLTERLLLGTTGEWLLVKKRLNVGEQRAYFARLYIAGADGIMRANPLNIGAATVLAYLLDWNLTEDNGEPLPSIRDESPDAVATILDSLDPETFAEIREAIDAHVDKETKAREQEKNAKAGRTTSAETSPSLSAADSHLPTSVN
jgi:hypothetical protein